LGIENFIEDALYKPNDYIGYHVGRRLAELHQAIPESEWKHARELGEAAVAAKAPTRSGRPLRAGTVGIRGDVG